MGLGKTIKKAYMKGKKKAYGSKGVKGRYVRPGFTKGMGNLIKDVEMIKSRLNVEKKHKEVDVSTFTVGQVFADTDGAQCVDITPEISRGTNFNERIGNSLKMTGITMPMNITQQAYCLGDRKLRITLLRVQSADNGVSTQEALEQVWEVNRLVGLGVRDFNAPRRYRNSKQDGITVVRSQVVYLKGPQLDNGSIGISEQERNVKTMRFNVKLNDVLRFDESWSATKPAGIRYYLVFQADAGNHDTVNVSTLDVPVKVDNSGMTVRLGQRYWYVDN
jgi:hypothetical protein